ncbi:MAG: hypothetical protein J5528_03815, partial [Firmicutes bacterium]|nr:hypothetical protein [Bacillota bacterium]
SLEKCDFTKEEIVDWISQFKYGNIDDKQYQKEIIDIFINSIYVYDDKYVFTYNFKDNTDALTLEEVNFAFGSYQEIPMPPNGNDGSIPSFLFVAKRREDRTRKSKTEREIPFCFAKCS